MKVQSTGNKQKGSSTLEILIAFAVLVLTLTAVIMVGFGNQSISVDSETNNEALYKAQKILEDARATSRSDFHSVLSTPSTEDSIYEKKLDVIDITPCQKKTTSTITWSGDYQRTQTINLSTFLTDILGTLALGGDCEAGGDREGVEWDNPTSYDFSDPVHAGSSGTDVDVLETSDGRTAVLTTVKSGNQDTLWIIDANDEESPFLINSYSTDNRDFLAVDTANNYAYIASASTTAQLQIIDISDTGNPKLISKLALPGVAGSNPQAISIYFYNNTVYVGTKRTAGSEFHVIDVSDPKFPDHLGDLELNHNVHDIVVRDSYAYIASSADNCELIVIDISNPGSMTNQCPAPPIPANATVFNANGNFDGTAVFLLGNKAYLGRARAQTSNDFYILNISSLDEISSLGSINLNLNSNTEVTGLAVRSNLAFIATSDTTPANGGGPFMVYNIQEPDSISIVSTCSLNYSEKTSGLDYHDDLIFLSNESNSAFRILYPALTCS